MRIKTKFLYLVFLIAVSFFLILLLNTFYSVQRSKFISLQNEGFLSVSYLEKITIASKDLLYTNYLDNAEANWKKFTTTGVEEISGFFNKKFLANLVKRNEAFSENYDIVLYSWENAKREMSVVTEQLEKIRKDDPDALKGIYFLLEENKGKYEYFQLFTHINNIGSKINIVFLENFEKMIMSINDEIKKMEMIFNIIVVFFSTVIILSLIIIFLKFSKNLNNKFIYLEKIMKSVSERDFSVEIESEDNDELGRLANYTKESILRLKDIFNKIKGVSVESNDLSGNISYELTNANNSLTDITGSIKTIKNEFEHFNNNILSSSNSSVEIQNNLNSLAEQIQTQAATVIQSSSSIEEIITSINNISAITQDRKESAEALNDIVKIGDKDITETNVFIQEIHKNSQNIQEILTIINGISVQINLLSMNAAIEAAHAGEAGKGFSVVADEIRNLAESTNENSKNIGKYVQHIITLINNTSEVSNKNLKSFQSIIEEVNKFVLLFEEISSGLQQMSIGSKEILEVNRTLNDLTLDVKNKYNFIIDENQEIGAAMTNLNNISGSIFGNISEIYKKIENIMNATSIILQKQNESKENSVKMNDELSKFKT